VKVLLNVPETTKDEDAAQFFNICGGMTVDSSRAETLAGKMSISLRIQKYWKRKKNTLCPCCFFTLPFTLNTSTSERCTYLPGTVLYTENTEKKSSAEYRLCYTGESLKTCSQWKKSRRNQRYRYLPA
jgi:hypothetical protein